MRARWGVLVALAVGLGAWELFVDLGGADPLILPPPHAVAQALFDDRGLLWSNFLTTALEIVLGMAVAASLGLGAAVLLHFFDRTLRPSLYPLLIASQAVPIVLLAPVLVLWLGFGLIDKLVVIAVVSFFSFVVTTLAGLNSVDPDLIKLMRTLDATRAQIFRFVELPAALPGLLTGAKIAVVFAPIAAVLAEQAGSSSGLGFVLQEALGQYLVARMWATVLILAAFAITLFALLTLAERRIVPWAHRPRGDRP